MSVAVIILAGARNKGPLKKVSPTEHEALIEIGELPMVEYVIRAANKAKLTGKVVVVGPVKELEEKLQEKTDYILNSGRSIRDNLNKGMEALGKQDYVLLMSSDIPLVTADIIDDFISTCLKDNEADVYYPIIPREENKAKYPSVKRTYFRLLEGVFTGGNMVLINPSILQGAADTLDKAFSLRKKPWKLSQLLGMKFILKFVIRHLSISEIEERVRKITGYRGHFMITQYPEIGFDVDKPSDLMLIRDKYIL
ncbi:MAG TPA: NTP transferase domain-containing protein [Halanaerobiales bacterium]|nr:NTP transferase domain-containing protein [Halanaerobiales bacterium]